jgi:hypothetical protein
LVLAFVAGCGAPPPTPHDSRSQGVIQWEPIKRWSGRGDQQLDSFHSDSGALRIEWEAKRSAGASEEPRVFFMEIKSTDVDWTIAVSERVR